MQKGAVKMAQNARNMEKAQNKIDSGVSLVPDQNVKGTKNKWTALSRPARIIHNLR